MKTSTLAGLVTITLALGAAPAMAAETPWRMVGTLSEACTCHVPCACNFGESPSPHAFCWAMIGMTISDGSYGSTWLAGTRMGMVQGAKGVVVYLDPSASKEQAAALRKIVHMMWVKALKANGVTDLKKVPVGFDLLGFKTARIEHRFGNNANHVLIENAGRFDGNYILGIDGRTPVGVENNWSFNIQRAVKAKASVLRYHDAYGNRFDMTGTNSNQGQFDWSDTTPLYFR